jgi:hypothetical protein
MYTMLAPRSVAWAFSLYRFEPRTVAALIFECLRKDVMLRQQDSDSASNKIASWCLCDHDSLFVLQLDPVMKAIAVKATSMADMLLTQVIGLILAISLHFFCK